MSFVPEIIVGISYYPCGVFLGYTMYTFMMPNPSKMLIWPQVLVMVGALVSAVILFFSRIIAKRVVFLHFYLMALGGLFMMIGGMMVVFFWDFETILWLGGLGYGLFYIAGLAYIHIRSNSKHRLQRIAFCHLWLMLGTVMSVHLFSPGRFRLRFHMFGNFLMYSSASVLFFLIINELLHGLKVYNYKKILDERLRAGDKKKDNFSSVLIPQNVNKTPENGKQFGLTSVMILTKLLNGFMYNNIFLLLTIASQSVFIWFDLFFISHYFIMGGLIMGIIISLSVRVKFLFGGAIICSSIFLLLAGIIMETYEFQIAAIFFWIFYFLSGTVSFFPDAGLMEMSSLKIYELMICAGVILEQIPIMVSIYIVNDGTLTNSVMWTNIGIYIGLAVILGGIVMKWYPDTYQKSVFQIQQLVLYGIGGRDGTIFDPPGLETRPETNIHHHPIPQHVSMLMMQPQPQSPHPAYALHYPQQPQAGLIPGSTPFYNQGHDPVIVGATMKHSGELPMYPPQYSEGKPIEPVNPSAPALTPNTELTLERYQIWALTQANLNSNNNIERTEV